METSTLATSRCRGVSTITTLWGGCDTFLSPRSTLSMATNSSRSPGLSSWRWRSFSIFLPRSPRETSSSTRPRASTAARRSSLCLRASGPAPGTSVSASQRWYLYYQNSWRTEHAFVVYCLLFIVIAGKTQSQSGGEHLQHFEDILCDTQRNIL